ncbi:GNAT family N-acetyltransferase [Yoonia sp. BS5-3]|uniref:N-acetyltransferase family protein n=1 Tax=Yoonia phaeophyticola TaxID=3137369 RepID=A0ABZ2V3M6_9RHOB
MLIRQASLADIPQMSAFLQRLQALGKRTRPADPDFVRDTYITSADKLSCALAEKDGIVLGFQVLIYAKPGNTYDVTPGWGIIGTHVNPDVARQGVGKALFAATRVAAQTYELEKLDATIGEENAEGLGYYAAMGFETYRRKPGVICKCFELTTGAA